MSKADEICARLRALLLSKGGDLYGGEAVTQESHALQAAFHAKRDGQAAHIIVAAPLHDVGHLFEVDFDKALDSDTDQQHEQIGYAFLKRWFGPDVTEPVRLHVAAKRYLCATRPGCFATLSPASVHSLVLQGGPMSPAEVAAFETQPHYRAAVQVRIYDDLAKDPQLQTPDIEQFLRYVPQLVR